MSTNIQKVTLTTLFAVLIVAACPCSLSAQSAAAPPATSNVIYRFLADGFTQSGYSHGARPYDEVIQGADGNFYGRTTIGGSGSCTGPFGVQGCGTVFKLTPKGVQTVIYNFALDSNGTTAVNGIYPYGGLVSRPRRLKPSARAFIFYYSDERS